MFWGEGGGEVREWGQAWRYGERKEGRVEGVEVWREEVSKWEDLRPARRDFGVDGLETCSKGCRDGRWIISNYGRWVGWRPGKEMWGMVLYVVETYLWRKRGFEW